MNNKFRFLRGDIYYADLNPVKGSEQGGIRPVLVVQNDVGNRYAPTIIILPITGQVGNKKNIPTHFIIKEVGKLPHDSLCMAEQLRVIDKCRVISYVGHLPEELMQTIVREAIMISLALNGTSIL